MSSRFVEAVTTGADTWASKVARNEPVTVGERHAFLGQAAGLMDVMARPGRVLQANGIVPPMVPYRGGNANWNGREVPLLGSMEPPSSWLMKPARTAGEAGQGFTLGDLLEPTEAERRRYWLALHGALKNMNGSCVVLPESQRAAGVLPVAAVVVIAVAAIAALATVVGYGVDRLLRENGETARHAADLEEATRQHAERIRYQATHPGAAPLPPGPAEVRVMTPPPTGGPPPAQTAADRALEEILSSLKGVLVVGAVGLVAVTAGPPIIANLADRATRERHA